MKFFFDKDVSIDPLKKKTIAVIGFGSQGEAQAKNLKDSGLNVIVGLRKNSKSKKKAEKFGLQVFTVSDAVKKGDIIHLLIPDEVQSAVFKKEIDPYLDKSKALSFAHGYNIVFGKIVPPINIDVFMISPHAPGVTVRKNFLEKKGVPAIFSVYQNKSGGAKKLALSLAKGCGFTRAGVYEATFKQETFSDLFAEQAVLCGGLSELVKKGFETLVEAGYPKHLAYMACAHEIGAVAQLITDYGIEGMFKKISNTAEFGARIRGQKIIDLSSKKNMKKILKEIEGGKFSKKWAKESYEKFKLLNKMRKKQQNSKMEKTFKLIKK